MVSKSRQEIERIQHELARRGYDPGPIDGVWGRMTGNAVRQFQADHDLVADGVVGPITYRALFKVEQPADPANNPGIPWFQEARRLIGVREDVGPGSEPAIIDWAQDRGIDYKSDDIPWCGLFVAHCVGTTLAQEKLPGNPLGARSWLKFGAPCDAGLGSVLVFWRGSPSGWKGHVGFYCGEDDRGAFHVLGGNQGNAVSVTRIEKNRLLGARWPSSAPISPGGKVQLAADSTFFSTNEA